jgi:hypothetical protein
MDAEGGTVNYTVFEPASEQASWTVSIENASGSLSAGQQTSVTVTLTPTNANSPDLVDITVDPGGATVQLWPVSSLRKEQ